MSLINIYHNFILLFKECFGSFVFFMRKLRYQTQVGNYLFPYNASHKGQIVRVLANGPSLNDEIDDLINKKVDLSNSAVVNYFATTDYFLEIKPKYYFLADPLFFTESKYTDKVYNLFTTLNESVTWDITLFVWKEGLDTIKKHINNKMIKIIGIGTITYDGFESKRNQYYKKGLAVPSYVNVTIMCIYVLLNMGYSTICLFGVDHSFLSSICTDDDNDLCVVDHHFYGDEYRKIIEVRNGVKWGVAEYVYNYYLTFLEHKRMNSYSQYLGAKIINCTRKSWIDAYTRIAQLEKNNKF